MVTFYADENVDGPIIEGLRRRGVDVLTIQEDGRSGLKPDSRVLDRSTELERVLISMDIHLEQEAYRRQRTGQFFGGVFFASKNPSRWGTYIDYLEAVAKAADYEEYHNRFERI